MTKEEAAELKSLLEEETRQQAMDAEYAERQQEQMDAYYARLEWEEYLEEEHRLMSARRTRISAEGKK